MLFLCLCLLAVSAGQVWATHYHDDFSNGLTGGGWNGNVSYWSDVYVSSASHYYYQGNYNGDTSAYATNWALSTAWVYKTDFSVLQGYNGNRYVNYDLTMDNSAGSLMLADVEYDTSGGSVYIQLEYYSGGTWTTVIQAGWYSGASGSGTLQIQRDAGGTGVALTLTCNNGFTKTLKSSPIPQSFLDGLTTPGLRVFEGQVNFTNADLVTGGHSTHQFDDISGGLSASGWNGNSSYWSSVPIGTCTYRANYNGDTSSYAANWAISKSFQYKTRFSVIHGYNSNQFVNYDLRLENAGGNNLMADVEYSVPSQQVYIQVEYWSSGKWNNVLTAGWLNSAGPTGTLEIDSSAGSSNLTLKLNCDNGFSYTSTTSTIGSSYLSSLTTPGLRVYEGVVDFSNASLVTNNGNTQYSDNFASGLSGSGWNGSSSYWSVFDMRNYNYQANSVGDVSSYANKWTLQPSWVYKADFSALQGFNSGHYVNYDLAMCNSSGNEMLYDVEYDTTANEAFIQLQYLTGGNWTTVWSTGWYTSIGPTGTIKMSRAAGSGQVTCSLACNNGFTFSFTNTSTLIPVSFLDGLVTPGLRVYAGQVNFANIDLITGAAPESSALQLGRSSVDDLMEHFWTGNMTTGYITPTWGGYPGNNLYDPRGGLWERGTYQDALYGLWDMTQDSIISKRIQMDWNYMKSVFTTSDLTTCGNGTASMASDDAGWNAMLYLRAYTITNDATALQDAETLVNNAYNRWYDSTWGGGMWYSDAKLTKSLYEVGIALDAQKLYSLTSISTFNTIATNCYNWMQSHLLRSDNIYWCDYNSSGGVGGFNNIGQAGSVSFVGGNMGMALMSARYYSSTQNSTYLTAAVNTVTGIMSKEVDANGVILDDRDAWTDGTFGMEFTKEVLPLSGISSTAITDIRNTAPAIYNNDRTTGTTPANVNPGYYGGCWDGPISQPNAWTSANGTYPQQIMTSANAVNMIEGAARLQ